MKIQKLVLSSFMIAGFVMLCNLRGGATAYAVELEERMDNLETRIAELTSAHDDTVGRIEEHGTLLEGYKGLQERVSVGFGLRTEFSTTEDEAGTRTDGVAGGRSWDKDFDVTNMRLYFGGKVTDNIRVEFNTEITDTSGTDSGIVDDIRLLDAFVEYTWNDYFHVRFGRHLPASDRYNLDGPYYQNSYDFPGIVQRYPNISTGRVEGVSYWGQYKGGKFKWQFTMSEGREISESANDDWDHFQYSGRLTYNFWEPEPGFYNSSTFYGKKDVLAIGLVGFYQPDGVGSIASDGSGRNYKDFRAWNIDFLLEKTYEWGTIDIEAAYFDFNTGGVSGTDDGNQADGQSWTVGFSYLYPEKIGWGQPQFVSRWQQFDPTDNVLDSDGLSPMAFAESKLELGLHYIIQGHNAKIALVWSNTHLGNSDEFNTNDDIGAVKLGMQFQH